MKTFSLAFVLVLGLALAGCGWNPFHKIYSATALIQITPRIYSEPLFLVGPNGPPDGPTQIATEIKNIQSDDILTPIVQELKLDQVWARAF
jgi:uncharacterized protein involved in exopolysaccharide biosynthesis